MAARAIASTTISFGLVSLPVRLYSTGEPGSRVSFNLVHAECGTRLKQHYSFPQCDVTVARDDMAKGYEFSKGQYVLFQEDELKAIEAPKTKESGRVAIAKYATRSKQYLVMTRPHEEGLVVDQLRYADEVRSFAEVPIAAADVKPAEKMLELIQRKVEG